MPDAIIYEAAGENGRFLLMADRIYLNRDGFRGLPYGFEGEKVIFIKFISALQLRRTSTMKSGFLQIEFLGRAEQFESSWAFTGSVDENMVTFSRQQEPDFVKFRDLLAERMAVYHTPPTNP
jgi:hypothetical protein